MMTNDKNWQPKYLPYVTMALVTSFLTSNILAFKVVTLGGLTFGASAVFFPFSLVIGDMLSEIYGYRRTRSAVVIGLISYCYFVVVSQITTALPPAPQWHYQDEYARFFSSTLRVFIGGCCAYLAGELVNAYILTRLKVKQQGKHFWLRATAASIIGELTHSGVRAPIAFSGVLSPDELINLVVTATAIKCAVQMLVLPFTSYCVRCLKQAEGVDHFDK